MLGLERVYCCGARVHAPLQRSSSQLLSSGAISESLGDSAVKNFLSVWCEKRGT